MMRCQSFFTTDEATGAELEAQVSMTHPGDPGRTYGLPEDCYPSEPPEFEIVSWTINDKPVSEKEVDGLWPGGLQSALDSIQTLALESDFWLLGPIDPDYLRDMRDEAP